MKQLLKGKPQKLVPIVLSEGLSPEDYPFANLAHYTGDLALLNYLLQDLRVVTRQLAGGLTNIKNYEPIMWEVHGLKRRTILCDVDRLVEPKDRLVVGFFGARRNNVPEELVGTTEFDVVDQFRHFPGIISYSSIELFDSQWVNLVVHSHSQDREDWRHSKVHIKAAEEIAPLIYHNVRIHNGCVPTGPIGSKTVVIKTTKYWDYDSAPTWHAYRGLLNGITEANGSASSGLSIQPRVN